MIEWDDLVNKVAAAIARDAKTGWRYRWPDPDHPVWRYLARAAIGAMPISPRQIAGRGRVRRSCAQTLLSRATPRRANGDPIENEMTSVNSDVLLAAFDEIERLRARVEVLEYVLRDARHNGLIYWEPQTTRGAVQRANMMSRIDFVLNKGAQP
jgi:hypothetical protein